MGYSIDKLKLNADGKLGEELLNRFLVRQGKGKAIETMTQRWPTLKSLLLTKIHDASIKLSALTYDQLEVVTPIAAEPARNRSWIGEIGVDTLKYTWQVYQKQPELDKNVDR